MPRVAITGSTLSRVITKAFTLPTVAPDAKVSSTASSALT